jgi:hypothetical protein
MIPRVSKKRRLHRGTLHVTKPPMVVNETSMALIGKTYKTWGGFHRRRVITLLSGFHQRLGKSSLVKLLDINTFTNILEMAFCSGSRSRYVKCVNYASSVHICAYPYVNTVEKTPLDSHPQDVFIAWPFPHMCIVEESGTYLVKVTIFHDKETQRTVPCQLPRGSIHNRIAFTHDFLVISTEKEVVVFPRLMQKDDVVLVVKPKGIQSIGYIHTFGEKFILWVEPHNSNPVPCLFDPLSPNQIDVIETDNFTNVYSPDMTIMEYVRNPEPMIVGYHDEKIFQRRIVDETTRHYSYASGMFWSIQGNMLFVIAPSICGPKDIKPKSILLSMCNSMWYVVDVFPHTMAVFRKAEYITYNPITWVTRDISGNISYKTTLLEGSTRVIEVFGMNAAERLAMVILDTDDEMGIKTQKMAIVDVEDGEVLDTHWIQNTIIMPIGCDTVY